VATLNPSLPCTPPPPPPKLSGSSDQLLLIYQAIETGPNLARVPAENLQGCGLPIGLVTLLRLDVGEMHVHLSTAFGWPKSCPMHPDLFACVSLHHERRYNQVQCQKDMQKHRPRICKPRWNSLVRARWLQNAATRSFPTS